MKKTILIMAMAIAGFMVQSKTDAQRVSLNINIGSQPVWGPTGYDYAEYYYFPDIDAYYYVPQRQFIYLQGNRWVTAMSLPPRYRNFDLYNGYKVVINEPTPYLRDNIYRSRYAQYRGRRGQLIIRDSHEPKYFVIKEHPEHNKWRDNDRREDRREDRRDDRRDNRYGHRRN